MNRNICKFSSPSLSEGLTVSCFVLESDAETMVREHSLKQHYMILVSKGEGAFLFDGERAPFRTGTLIFGFRGEVMRVCAEREAAYLYLAFDGARADTLLRRFSICPATRTHHGFDGLLPLWSESLARASSETVDLAAESILLYTFSRLFGSASEQNGLVQKIVALTEEHFADPALCLSSLAAELSYNPKYLSHAFKARTGIGYSAYLRSLRIKYAISLFDHGLDSIKNVALLSGFPDPLYFSSVFKKAVGLSPREYVLARSSR